MDQRDPSDLEVLEPSRGQKYYRYDVRPPTVEAGVECMETTFRESPAALLACPGCLSEDPVSYGSQSVALLANHSHESQPRDFGLDDEFIFRRFGRCRLPSYIFTFFVA